MIILTILTLLFGSIGTVFAQVQYCSDYSYCDLRNAPIGFRCATSKGYVYTKVSWENAGESWRGGPDAIVWSDHRGLHANEGADSGNIVVQSAAVNACLRINGFLPLLDTFKRHESYGFREVLPVVGRGQFWSGNVSDETWGATCTLGRGRDAFNCQRSSRSLSSSVVCIR